MLTVAWNIVFDDPLLGITMKGVKESCDETGFACSVATSIFFTVGPLAVGSFVFVFWRLQRVQRPLVAEARERPAELVETAGEIGGRVVGRDDVCNVLQDDLRDNRYRRPHVVVGGVGVGKTAVLVRMTELLARRGAVPVPIRLRDASGDVDFLEMAQQVFLRTTQSSQWLASEADRAWNLLTRSGKIVVLADGLEEAFADNEELARERDHRVRVAVSQARKRGYPLVITSRAHEALSALDANLLRLEPLSQEAAIEYIEEGHPLGDEPRVARVVETANVVEAPLYLQIARELHENGQLRAETLDTRSTDRVLLRMNLMQSWIEALTEGKLDRTARVPLNYVERRRTVIQLAALACCGLAHDSQEVSFKDLEKRGYEALMREARKQVEQLTDTTGREAATGRKPRGLSMSVAASNGARLGLVEPRTHGVRFRHSIMQAYLGSTVIGAALKAEAPDPHDPDPKPSFSAEALRAPGRELLVALIMFSRSADAAEPHPEAGGSWRSWLTQELCRHEQESGPTDAKAFELLSAAVEVDSIDFSPANNHTRAASGLVKKWRHVSSRDDATRDAKTIAISRLGDAALRLKEARSATGSGDVSQTSARGGQPAFGLYRCLYDICCAEEHYPIRLAAVQEIGAGGTVAFEELQQRFRDGMPRKPERRIERIRHAARTPEGEQEYMSQAWLLPMLAGSASRNSDAASQLEEWLELVGEGLPLSLEAALAQGFKYAANRRPRHPYENAEMRSYLAAQAAEMLQRADFWFSRLTLLHALALWALSGTVYAPREVEDRQDSSAIVERWIARHGKAEHRFVLEAGELTVKALEKRQPERFMWIDESMVATTVGSRPRAERPRGVPTLWIPPSAGWLALNKQAQQLVADMLILLTLAERGDTPPDRARNLRRINRLDLPLCLTEERCDYLRPTETAGVTQRSPGDKCKGGCPVGLCPYPPKGQQPYRVELGEAFCRHQRVLLGSWTNAPFARRAGWQHAPRPELRRFWSQMEERART